MVSKCEIGGNRVLEVGRAFGRVYHVIERDSMARLLGWRTA